MPVTRLVFVDCFTDWCGPCNMLEPVLQEISASRDDVTVAKVNVDQQPELAAQFGIRSIPALLFFKDGEVADRITGVAAKSAIESKLDVLAN